MNITDRLAADLKDAMRSGDPIKRETIRSLRGAIKNSEIEKGSSLDDEEILRVLQKAAKQRRDSVSLYEEGNRQDLADKEKSELQYIESYLPQQLSPSELKTLISTAIDEVGASSMADMGKVMSNLMPKISGKADGSQVNKIAKSMLMDL